MVSMKALSLATAVLSFAAAVVNGESNLTKPLSSTKILPASFKPPQVFKNANLVHLVNLEKGYPRESVNVVIENIGSGPEDEYYIPFTPAQMEKIGTLEVKDKKAPESPLFTVEAVKIDPSR
jgi:oligosaccharyltransferase complex subunit alpha (ribophorin I)